MNERLRLKWFLFWAWMRSKTVTQIHPYFFNRCALSFFFWTWKKIKMEGNLRDQEKETVRIAGIRISNMQLVVQQVCGLSLCKRARLLNICPVGQGFFKKIYIFLALSLLFLLFFLPSFSFFLFFPAQSCVHDWKLLCELGSQRVKLWRRFVYFIIF